MPRIEAKRTKPKGLATARKIRVKAARPRSAIAYSTTWSLLGGKRARIQRQGRDFASFLNQPVSSSAGLVVAVAVSAFFLFEIMSLAKAPIPLTTATLPPISSRTRLYISKTYGYQLRYPNTWVYEVRPVGEFEEVILIGGGDKVVVATTNEVSTSTLIPAAPETLVLNGINAFRYHDYDSLTGQPQDRVVIKRPDGLYHEILGYGPRFERLIKSFALSNQ